MLRLSIGTLPTPPYTTGGLKFIMCHCLTLLSKVWYIRDNQLRRNKILYRGYLFQTNGIQIWTQSSSTIASFDELSSCIASFYFRLFLRCRLWPLELYLWLWVYLVSAVVYYKVIVSQVQSVLLYWLSSQRTARADWRHHCGTHEFTRAEWGRGYGISEMILQQFTPEALAAQYPSYVTQMYKEDRCLRWQSYG